MSPEQSVQWLEEELNKRLGPWVGPDRKGNPENKEPLQTPIVMMPNTAAALLEVARRGMNQEATS